MKHFLIVLLSSLFLGSCNLGVAGNGKVQEEPRDLTKFTKIVISGSLKVIITQNGRHKAMVKADENLLPFIETRVEGETLYLETTEFIREAEELKVFLSADVLETIETSGAVELKSVGPLKTAELILETSGAVEADLDLEVDYLECSLSGASQLALSGKAIEVLLRASGASQINGFNLAIENLKINTSGACEAEIFVINNLSVNLSGASEVKYKGQPKINKTVVSGASELKAVD